MKTLIEARATELAYYSPYYFLRQLSAATQQELYGTGAAMRWSQVSGAQIHSNIGGPKSIHWLLQHLQWDSTYFETPVFRLFTGLFDDTASDADLAKAAAALGPQLAAQNGAFYAYSVVPAEDVKLLQGLTAGGWRLVETRLTYYRDKLAAFDYERFPVRAAKAAEGVLVGQIAASARNPYDRFHADAWFGEVCADAYLARYGENTVTTKLASTVLVPDSVELPIDSFLAISDLVSDSSALGKQLSRVLLTAVGAQNRGWHVKLMAETLHRAKDLGHEAVLMTTQATNHAVFRSCEKLGFHLGSTSHVLAYHAS
ncbi:hypothetical protein [Hymenobacter sp. B1770]|uniref:hypothetical protein n=1 Tax=Hymenobacter sp. B1770 TaxID=1718788 RepID=UPI003CEB96EE